MTQVIRLSDEIFARLQSIAVPFVDTPTDVIERLLDVYEGTNPSASAREPSEGARNQAQKPTQSELARGGLDPLNRVPRERGVTVSLDGTMINADTVRDLYEQSLKLLSDRRYLERLEPHIPFKTSPQRYLIAKEPVHPSGGDFVVPVKYGEYYIEAHKDYKTAIRQLKQLTSKCGVTLQYMG